MDETDYALEDQTYAVIGAAIVIDRITNHERGQMINYLRITGLPLGLIFNFRYSKLQWERLALTR
ncbi:MAG TPA: GxxExxY protein [Chthoniobacterales bacterium]|jgi:GxxExxY protein